MSKLVARKWFPPKRLTMGVGLSMVSQGVLGRLLSLDLFSLGLNIPSLLVLAVAPLLLLVLAVAVDRGSRVR